MVEYSNVMAGNMCRVCLKSEEENSFKNMQIPYMENEEEIAIMFCAIGKVKYAPNDGLPQKICDQCLNELIVCYEFQKKCIQSDIAIRNIIENPYNAIDFENYGESETEIKAQIISVRSDDEKYENIQINKIEEFQIESKSQNQNNSEVKTNIKTLEVNDCTDLEYGKDTSRDAVAKEENISNKKQMGIEENVIINDMIDEIELSDPKKKNKACECVMCKWRFASQKNLTNHEIKHNTDLNFTKTNEKGFQCSYCPRNFAKRESLSEHMGVHKSHVPKDKESDKKEKHFVPKKSAHLFQCKICKKSFNQPYNLKGHMRNHSGKKPYLCSVCGRAFYNSSTLKQHIKRHSGVKPFECSECPSKFTFSSGLKSHMLTHTKLQPYACNLCGSKFTKRSSLKIHNLVHTGEKPFECQTCHMRFTRTSHVKRHNLIHTGEKPHCCKYCGKAYVQSNDHVKHLKTHLGNKIYKCSKCSESFRLQVELRDHLSEHYRKEKQVKKIVEDINTKDTKEEYKDTKEAV